MNAIQENLLTTGHAVSDTLETLTATRTLPALAAKQAALKTCLADIATQAAIQTLPILGRTRDRDQVVATAAEAARVVAGLVLSYAKARALADLAEKIDIAPSQFVQCRLNARVRLMEQVHTAATGVLAELGDYGVTAATLADLQAKIEAANERLDAPRATIATRRVATENLAEACDTLSRLLKDDIDPLMESVRPTDPAGYAQYQAARVVIERPGNAGKPTAPAALTPATNRAAVPPVAERQAA